MSNSEIIKADICIIGAGLAGLAATLFAADRGLACVTVGQTGEINFTTGFLDLLGVHPAVERHTWKDPWAGIDALVRDNPEHPYARLTKEDIREAFEETLNLLQAAGLPYERQIHRNSSVLTSLGTLKPTYCVPHTMWQGVKALKKKPACLLVDFQGHKGFSARQIAAALEPGWPDLRTVRVSFPETDHFNEVFAEHMARALILPQTRDKFVRTLQPHIKEAQIIGLPAMLGLYRTQEVFTELQKTIGVPLFEIPTIPPSVPGLRLKDAFERGLRTKSVQYFSQRRVVAVRHRTDAGFEVDIGQNDAERTVRCRGVVLASGRFIGGGLHADRKRVRETVFDLPVYQPDNRAGWHRRDFLDSRGHLLNLAGVEIDESFRPLNSSRQPAFENLFAAGSILAHQDWMRMKCGSGLAIATAYAAVQNYLATQP